MSGSLLHRAPSHQPPPPPASKSRSRGSCHDDGVPNLHLSAAHYSAGDVVEVEVTHYDPPRESVLSTHRPLASTTAPFSSTSYAAYRPSNVQRSRLEADEEPLQDSMSFSEATASLEGNGLWHAHPQEDLRDSVESSVVFDGRDNDVDEVNNADVTSTSFCEPTSEDVNYDGPVSSAGQSSMLYEDRDDEGGDGGNGSRSLQRCPYDRTAAPRDIPSPLHVAAHCPLRLEGQPERTSRKLEYSASVVLTSLSEASARGVKGRTMKSSNALCPPAFDGDEGVEENASSPQLRHGVTTNGVSTRHDAAADVWSHPRRMASLIAPLSAEDEEDASESHTQGVICGIAKANAKSNSRSSSSSDGVAAQLGTEKPRNASADVTPRSELHRADAEMESAMKEMAARLRSHDVSGRHTIIDGDGGRGADERISGAVRSKENSPSTPRSSSTASSSPRRFHGPPQHKLDRPLLSETPDEPHLKHERGVAADDLIDDPADTKSGGGDAADLVQSVRDVSVGSVADGVLFRHRTAIESPNVSEGAAEGDATPSAYTFFSSQLPPAVDRRAEIHKLAKIMRAAEVPTVATSPGLQPPPPRRGTFLTSPLTAPPPPPPTASRDDSSPLEEAAATAATTPVLYPPPITSTFAVQQATSPFSSQQRVLPGVLLAGAAASTAVTGMHVNHGISSTNTAVTEATTSVGEEAAIPLPAGQTTSSAEETAELHLSSAVSLTTPPSHRQRRPPRMLCPPTPSPSQPRADDDAEALPPRHNDDPVGCGEQHDGLDAAQVDASPQRCSNEAVEADVMPVVVPHSACAVITLAGLIPPFTRNSNHSACPPDTRRARSSSASVSAGVDAATVEDGGDFTASVLAVSKDEEKNEFHAPSVSGDGSSASAHAAENGVPVPPSPKDQRRPSSSSQRRSPVGERAEEIEEKTVRGVPAPATEHYSPDTEAQRGDTKPSGTNTMASPNVHSAAAVVEGDSLSRLASQENEVGESISGKASPPVLSTSQPARHRQQSKSIVSYTSSPLPMRPTSTSDASNEDDDEAHLAYDVIDGVHDAAPAAALNGNGSSWKGTAFSVDLFAEGDGDEVDEDDEQTSMEEMLQRAEGKNAVLRLELAAATNRATATEDALRMRDEECVELHALVDQLQAELAALREAAVSSASSSPSAAVDAAPNSTRADAEVQATAEYEKRQSCATLVSPADDQPTTPITTAPATAQEIRAGDTGDAVRNSSDERQRRYDTVVLELAEVKGLMAEQLAVLDRLGLYPPFTEDVVAAAQRRLRHVKVVNTPMKVEETVTTTKTETPDGGDPPLGVVPQTKVRVGDKNTVLSLLAQRKQQQQQYQQGTSGQRGLKPPVVMAKLRADNTRTVANAKENLLSS